MTRREDAVRVSACSPHDVVVRKGDVDDGAQWLGVAEVGNAASGFCNSWRCQVSPHRRARG